MYPESTAAPRVRIAAMTPGLAAAGVDLSFTATLSPDDYAAMASPGGTRRKFLLSAGAAVRLRAHLTEDADLRLVHRLATPTPVPGLEPLKRLDAYDFDDSLHLGAIGAANARFAFLKREAQRWFSYVRHARLVIAGNGYLADAAAPLARRVEVVPSCVAASGQPLHEHSDRARLVVGWIGSPSTATYLGPVIEAVARVRGSGADIVMRVVGAHVPGAPSWLDSRPWTLEAQAAELADFDIGVMPLPNDPWTRGKCGYKLLQYSAAGVPFVCSPVGVNVDIAGDGCGLLATTVDEWQKALTALSSSVDERRERGLAARRNVERRFSYDVWAPRLAELLFTLS